MARIGGIDVNSSLAPFLSTPTFTPLAPPPRISFETLRGSLSVLTESASVFLLTIRKQSHRQAPRSPPPIRILSVLSHIQDFLNIQMCRTGPEPRCEREHRTPGATAAVTAEPSQRRRSLYDEAFPRPWGVVLFYKWALMQEKVTWIQRGGGVAPTVWLWRHS